MHVKRVERNKIHTCINYFVANVEGVERVLYIM